MTNCITRCFKSSINHLVFSVRHLGGNGVFISHLHTHYQQINYLLRNVNAGGTPLFLFLLFFPFVHPFFRKLFFLLFLLRKWRKNYRFSPIIFLFLLRLKVKYLIVTLTAPLKPFVAKGYRATTMRNCIANYEELHSKAVLTMRNCIVKSSIMSYCICGSFC